MSCSLWIFNLFLSISSLFLWWNLGNPRWIGIAAADNPLSKYNCEGVKIQLEFNRLQLIARAIVLWARISVQCRYLHRLSISTTETCLVRVSLDLSYLIAIPLICFWGWEIISHDTAISRKTVFFNPFAPQREASLSQQHHQGRLLIICMSQ